ncbi:carboxypeptidase-like regulatory domain-containing protein [Flavobacterium ginsengisoli]|uniref:carboxypeptidase-like regulatory domain-containing protein n=1 Tax=Flavobacterium ginsengisoli TaxID=871694 RepID=UPI003BF5C241
MGTRQPSFAGVNIIIKGTKTVTTTGFDGEYSIKASPTDVLVFSFIGFQNKEIAVGSQSKLDIALGEDTNKLNEVVVIGYGTQKKSDLTGSVSVVNLESAKKVVTYDACKNASRTSSRCYGTIFRRTRRVCKCED